MPAAPSQPHRYSGLGHAVLARHQFVVDVVLREIDGLGTSSAASATGRALDHDNYPPAPIINAERMEN